MNDGVSIERHGHVALVEFSRPPDNYFDLELITALADGFDALDADSDVRALVLASSGKVFCAGGKFSGNEGALMDEARPPDLYLQGIRLFRNRKPVIAAVQGAAIGGGLGLALAADFRVAAPEARFAANFVKLGLHAGFGITHSLPRLIGAQAAAELLYTGRRLDGQAALGLGLADRIAPLETLREEALRFAAEIAENAPLAVQESRATMRAGFADAIERQLVHEAKVQARLMNSEDFKEGVAAVRERRPGNWIGR